MVTRLLSRDEAEMLASMLQQWRDGMKRREVFINVLIGRLSAAAA